MIDWFAADRRHIWHPFTQHLGAETLPITHGQGPWLYRPDGSRLLDGISSWWVTLHGHAEPAIAEAIAQQARTLEQVIFAGFTHQPAAQLAEELSHVLPQGLERIFFSDDGSTAVEVALKLSLQYWDNTLPTTATPRRRFIALQDAYHGDTFGAMAVSERSVFTSTFQPLLFSVTHIPSPATTPLPQVLDALRLALAGGDVAALILEPLLQGVAGMQVYTPEALAALIQTAREANVLVIADEILTGFGRTGSLFASLQLPDAPPDLLCMSKGLTGGFLPLGLTACSERIFEAFLSSDRRRTFFHGHSFTANPLACAAARASLSLLQSAEQQAAQRRIEAQHAEAARQFAGHNALKAVRHIGTVLALEVAGDEPGYLSQLTPSLYKAFLAKDMLLRPLGPVAYVLPPLSTDATTLAECYEKIADVLDTLPV